MEPCYKGWGDEVNPEGRCCCTCKYQIKLMKHPWNYDIIFKGRISEQVMDMNGNNMYVCIMNNVLNGDNSVIAMSGEHDMCEMHTFKDEYNE